MKNITQWLLIGLFLVPFSTYADSKKPQGTATIKVDGTPYTLSLKKCYSATTIVKGKENSAFIISTHTSRRSQSGDDPIFSLLGTKKPAKTKKASFRLSINGGASKGGIGYRGRLPFESFVKNKLVFKGDAKSIQRKNGKFVNEVVPIEIKVSCN